MPDSTVQYISFCGTIVPVSSNPDSLMAAYKEMALGASIVHMITLPVFMLIFLSI